MEFKDFRKIPRLSREIILSEKLDGSNGQIFIYSTKDKLRFPFSDESNIPSQDFIDEYCVYIHPENPHVEEDDKLFLFAGSRNRWLKIGKQNDNHGFASWVKEHGAELVMLGEGRHYGEYYGKSIQRGYGLDHKRFALFNVSKWAKRKEGVYLNDLREKTNNPKLEYCPDCCEVVPILYDGLFDTNVVDYYLDILAGLGSVAVPGFMKPEGICVYHTAAGQYFKKTIENDKKHKGEK
jgi:hypothetical protein